MNIELQQEKNMRQQTISLQHMIQCGMFAALTAAGAFIKITIPVQPFPMHFTLQIFFVLLAGFLLGSRLGAVSILCYLLVGLSGVPVFASGGGLAYLLRPTFGFLLGMVAAAYVTGKVTESFRRERFGGLLLASACGLLAQYLCGMIYFYFLSNYVIGVSVTWRLVLINCFFLTIGEDFILSLLAAVLAVRLLPMLRRMQ